MSQPIDQERLAHLRTAAEVGLRMSSLHPHTVQVRPDELAALIDEVAVARAAGSVRVVCIHCKAEVCYAGDQVAIREHSMTCRASPVARELLKSRAIVAQAELIARRWDTQDGVNGAEIDTLRDLVFDRPEEAPRHVGPRPAQLELGAAPGPQRYSNHFATCPQASKWRGEK